MTGRRAVVKEPVVIPPVIVITIVIVPFLLQLLLFLGITFAEMDTLCLRRTSTATEDLRHQ